MIPILAVEQLATEYCGGEEHLHYAPGKFKNPVYAYAAFILLAELAYALNGRIKLKFLSEIRTNIGITM